MPSAANWLWFAREIGEDRDIEGYFVVEEPDTATDGGAIVFGGSEDETDTGSGVEHV